MKVAEETRRLGETTSVKGIPRILKAEYFPLKAIWFGSVTVFLGMAVYHTYILLGEYFSYPSITTVSEHHISLVDDAKYGIILPDLTLCNLNPLSERAYTGEDDLLSFSSYVQSLDESLHLVGALNTTHTDNDTSRYKEYLLDIRSYYGRLGFVKGKQAGHKEEEFIVSCKILILQGLDMNEIECNPIYTFPHPRYMNCFILSLGEQSPTQLKVGYSVTLHLANHNTSWYQHLGAQRDVQLGAVAVLHAPYTYPTIGEEGQHMSPGTHVNLRYSLEKRNRLPKPHGRCVTTEQIHQFMEDIFNTSGQNLNYTTAMCVSVLLESDVIEECDCKDLTLMQLLYEYGNSTGCGHHSKSPEQALRELVCASETRGKYMYDAMLNCPSPCEELLYKVDSSQSVWPPEPLTHQFYENTIQGRSYESKYASVLEAIQATQDGTLSDSQRHQALDLVRDNFLMINAYLGKLAVVDITDKPKVSVTSLTSQLGGTLNLWAGITVVLIVEFVDYLIRLLVMPSAKKPTPQPVKPIEPFSMKL